MATTLRAAKAVLKRGISVTQLVNWLRLALNGSRLPRHFRVASSDIFNTHGLSLRM